MLVAATSMSVLGYTDILFMHASSQHLHALDILYHGALRLKTNLKPINIIVSSMNVLGRYLCLHIDLHFFIYKAILVHLPSNLLTYINIVNSKLD